MKLSIVALALNASAIGCVFAAENLFAATSALANTSQRLETISITGARTPLPSKYVAGAISVITDPQIQASGALSIAELLRTVPSVNISQAGPMGTLTEIRFRGSESNHVLIMLDGVEINDLGQGGLIDLSHLLLANISRIEILRGPQSALWGSSAIAGIISITSKPLSNGSAGNIGLSYGNKDTSKFQGAYSDKLDNFRYSLSASKTNTRGENIARSGNEADGYENTTVFAKLDYTLSSFNRVGANLRIVDYLSDFDSTDFNTGLIADADNQSYGEQMSFAVNWDYSMPDSLWSQRLSYQYSEQENQNFSSALFSGATKGEKQRIIYTHNIHLTNGHLNIGAEAIDERFFQSGPMTFADPNQDQKNSSLSFITDTNIQLSHQLSVAASYRYDNNDEFNNVDSYRIGAKYRISDSIRSFLSYAKAIKNPTFTERFGFFPGTFLGNSELTPESSKALEIGISAEWQNYELQLSWYKAALENEIQGFVFDSGSGLFTATNADVDSDREGFEIEFSKTLRNLQWAVNYAYLDAKEADGIELRRARHAGSAWLSYEIDQAHQVYVQVDYAGNRKDRFFPPFPQASQVITLDNYWLVSTNYRYLYSNEASISVRLSNALNQSYEDVVGFSGESRRILLSLNYSW